MRPAPAFSRLAPGIQVLIALEYTGASNHSKDLTYYHIPMFLKAYLQKFGQEGLDLPAW